MELLISKSKITKHKETIETDTISQTQKCEGCKEPEE